MDYIYNFPIYRLNRSDKSLLQIIYLRNYTDNIPNLQYSDRIFDILIYKNTNQSKTDTVTDTEIKFNTEFQKISRFNITIINSNIE